MWKFWKCLNNSWEHAVDKDKLWSGLYIYYSPPPSQSQQGRTKVWHTFHLCHSNKYSTISTFDNLSIEWKTYELHGYKIISLLSMRELVVFKPQSFLLLNKSNKKNFLLRRNKVLSNLKKLPRTQKRRLCSKKHYRKSRFADPPQMWQYSGLRFADSRWDFSFSYIIKTKVACGFYSQEFRDFNEVGLGILEFSDIIIPSLYLSECWPGRIQLCLWIRYLFQCFRIPGYDERKFHNSNKIHIFLTKIAI